MGVTIPDNPARAIMTGFVVGWLLRADDELFASIEGAPSRVQSIVLEHLADVQAIAAPARFRAGLVDWEHVSLMVEVMGEARAELS
jgi:hypothetical protein